MDEQTAGDLQMELSELRQRLGTLEAEHREILRGAVRRRHPQFSRNFLFSVISVVLLLAVGGMLYGQSGGDALFIDPNGNVGIGTPRPGAKLDVAGTVRLGRGTSMESWFPYTDNKAYITGLETIIRKDGSTVLVKISDVGVGVGTKLDVAGTLNVADMATLKNATIDGGLSVMGTGNSSFAGNVGIGETKPSARLDVKGTGGATVDLRVSGRIRSNSVSGGLWLNDKDDGFVGNNDNNIGFWTSGAGWNAFQIQKSTGNVGIGTTDPAGNKLKVEGQANITGDLYVNGWIRQSFDKVSYRLHRDNLGFAGWTQDSDLHLKTDVRSIPSPLEKIARLRGVSYQWNRRGLEHLTREIETTISAGPGASAADNQKLWQAERDKRHKELSKLNVGVIAQEVEAVLPEAVTTDEAGYKSVRYHYLIPLLIEALKEQDKAFKEQTQTVARQQAEIERLTEAQQTVQQHATELAAVKGQVARLEAALQRGTAAQTSVVPDALRQAFTAQAK